MMDTKKFPEPQPFTDRERPPIALEPEAIEKGMAEAKAAGLA